MTTAQRIIGQVPPEMRAQIEEMLTGRSLSPPLRERLEMVKGVDRGDRMAVIASWSGRTEITVRRWLGVFAAGGITALADKPRSGRRVKADTAYLAALAEAVGTNPREVGQACDVWTSARLSAYLTETTGIRIAAGWPRVLLHREGFANGRPKHSGSHLQEPAEEATCEERLREVGEKGGGQPSAL